LKLAIHGGEAVRTDPFPSWPQWDDREEKNLLQVLHSGRWFRYQGDMVARFEKRFAEVCGARYGLAVTSGTKALEACVSCLDLPPGSEIIVPSYTFVSTATCVVNNNYQVVFADIDLETLNVTIQTLEAVWSPRTSAIIPVHFAGCPCDMDAIMKWARERGLKVIEDACHAHGGFWDKRPLGSIGDVGAFSFQASKNMTAGEGGIVLANSKEYMAKLYAKHSYGQRPGHPWYDHHVVSSNLRMTEWAGAVLLGQLERLGEQSQIRLENAGILDDAVEGIDGLKVVGTNDARASRRAYHLYAFRYLETIEGVTREHIARALQAEGIPASVGYPIPLNKQPLFDSLRPAEQQGSSFAELDMPGAAAACRQVLWLPQNVLLGSAEDTRDIARAMEKVMGAVDELREIELVPSG